MDRYWLGGTEIEIDISGEDGATEIGIDIGWGVQR